MLLETWITFIIASFAVVLIPGPNIILTVNYALRLGRKSGWATIPGVVAGAFFAMTLSLLGAGAIVAASATLFSLLKIGGAVYLFWLAYKIWTAPVQPELTGTDVTGKAYWSIAMQAFLTSALNPKGPIFYLAFVPQFVDASRPMFLQFAILEVTLLGVAAVNGLIWLVFASSLRNQLARPTVMRMLNRLSGGFLAGGGALTMTASHS